MQLSQNNSLAIANDLRIALTSYKYKKILLQTTAHCESEQFQHWTTCAILRFWVARKLPPPASVSESLAEGMVH